MTLITAMANRSYLLQVGDRLTSKPSSRPASRPDREPWEVLSNKALIYVASDAVVTISYSGIAYVGSANTDTWLAEQLDSDIARGPHCSLRVGSSKRRVDIGTAAKSLADSIDHTFASMKSVDRSSGLTLQIVGWKWSKDNPHEMPFIWHLVNSGANGALTQTERSGRYWGWESGQSRLDAIGDRRSNPLKKLNDRLSGKTELFADFIEQQMVGVIREASGVSAGGIGESCISILISLATCDVRVRYFPKSSASSDHEVFTPWIIAPGAGTSAPSTLVGALPSVHLGGLDVRFERLEPTADPFGFGGMSSLPRKPKPR
jgi:hypothetical protein